MEISKLVKEINEKIQFDGVASLFHGMDAMRLPEVIADLRRVGFNQKAILLEEVVQKFGPITNRFKSREEMIAYMSIISERFADFATVQSNFLGEIEKRYSAILGEDIPSFSSSE